MSPRAIFLRHNLADHPARCTLAYMHHPLYATGTGGLEPRVKPLWRILYKHGRRDTQRPRPSLRTPDPDRSQRQPGPKLRHPPIHRWDRRRPGLVAAYKTTSDSTVAAQQLGAQQIEYFFDTVINNLRTQTEGTLQVTQQLADQQELARESAQDLAQMSTDNYMDLLDSMFSFYQGGTSRTQRRAEEAQRRVEEAEARAQQADVRAEEAERSAEEADRRAEEAEKRAEEAERRTLEAQRRTEEAERSRSEAESQRGDAEGDTNAVAVHRPLSQWVRTSGRSKVRGRNTRSRGRSSGRR